MVLCKFERGVGTGSHIAIDLLLLLSGLHCPLDELQSAVELVNAVLVALCYSGLYDGGVVDLLQRNLPPRVYDFLTEIGEEVLLHLLTQFGELRWGVCGRFGQLIEDLSLFLQLGEEADFLQ